MIRDVVCVGVGGEDEAHAMMHWVSAVNTYARIGLK